MSHVVIFTKISEVSVIVRRLFFHTPRMEAGERNVKSTECQDVVLTDRKFSSWASGWSSRPMVPSAFRQGSCSVRCYLICQISFLTPELWAFIFEVSPG